MPDRQWLQSADRVWPVVLDPVTCATATAGTIEDVYARSGYPQNAYYLESFIFTMQTIMTSTLATVPVGA